MSDYQVCQACGAIFTVQGAVISGPCPCGSWTWVYPATITDARRIRREAQENPDE